MPWEPQEKSSRSLYLSGPWPPAQCCCATTPDGLCAREAPPRPASAACRVRGRRSPSFFFFPLFFFFFLARKKIILTIPSKHLFIPDAKGNGCFPLASPLWARPGGTPTPSSWPLLEEVERGSCPVPQPHHPQPTQGVPVLCRPNPESGFPPFFLPPSGLQEGPQPEFWGRGSSAFCTLPSKCLLRTVPSQTQDFSCLPVRPVELWK